MQDSEYANKAKSQFTKTVVNVLKIVGTALAIINGFIQPLSSLVYGKLTDDLMVPPSAVNVSQSNATNGNILAQNSTKNHLPLGLSKGPPFSPALTNSTGVLREGNNKTDTNQVSDNLKILQSATASVSGNSSENSIPTRLVLTPETNPLSPPGYGYPVMPGLIRLRRRPKNATKPRNPTGHSPADQERRISKYAMYYCYLALATFICSYGQMLCWSIASSKFFQEKQSEYVKLEEEDLDDQKENKKEREQNKEEESDEGIGSRITIIIQNVANFASSMLVSFIQNWQLTLMMLAAAPIMASVMFYMNKLKSFAMNKVKFLLQKARGVAKGAFAQVQTVAAFGGQDYEKDKFSSKLLAADKAAKIRSIVDAVRAGLMIVIAFIFLGLGFWFSAGLILDGTLTPGAFISIFMAIISSVLKLVNVGDSVKADNSKDDKKDEKSKLSSDAEEDERPNVIGKILEHLSSPEEVFKYYPNRPELMVKSSKLFEDSIHIELSSCGKRDDRSNMSENNTFENPLKENSANPSTGNHAKPDSKSFSQKFKEKIKSKFQKNKKYANTNKPDGKDFNSQSKFSIEGIKERFTKCLEKTKSCLETKVIGQVKKRGLSLEAVKLQIKQLPLIVLSLVGAIMTGMIAPGFSLLLSEILIVTADPKRLKAERVKWALKFVDLGVFIAIGSTVQKFSTSLSESRVEMGMKENAFNSTMDESQVPKTTIPNQPADDSSQSEESTLLKENVQDINKTEAISKENDLDNDDELKLPENQPKSKEKDLNLLDGSSNEQADDMTTKMDSNASSSRKSSFSLSTLTSKVSGSVSTIMTMLISFTNGWKMTLVVLAGLPIIAYAQSVQNADPENEKEKKEDEDGIISKLWKKIRGVTSSASSKVPASKYTSKYSEDCLKPYRYVVKTLIATGLAFAIAECVTFLVYAGALRYGGYLVRVGEMKVESVMTVLMTVLFGGAGSSNAPEEKSTTKNDTSEKDKLDDVKVKDVPQDEKPVKLNEVKGEVEFHDVEFHHPEKKSVLMSGLNISVKSSETLAIVGTTDFNSNSVIALVERFYDPAVGTITLDDTDIRSLDVSWLRSQIALVSQTGILNHHSVADNLLIGDSATVLTDEDLENISRVTHLHDSIHSLPKSYNSLVIDDVILNSITKQKLVITRALIRNPRILIIDEFSQSNAEVEESLRNLRLGRTCIIFARHLSTVAKADKIVIVCHGRIVEQGPRDVLMAKRGIFYHLMNTTLHSDIAPAL